MFRHAAEIPLLIMDNRDFYIKQGVMKSKDSELCVVDEQVCASAFACGMTNLYSTRARAWQDQIS